MRGAWEACGAAWNAGNRHSVMEGRKEEDITVMDHRGDEKLRDRE